MTAFQIALLISVAITVVAVILLISFIKGYRNTSRRHEYHSLQAVKPKLESYGMKIHEVKEGLYQVVQYARNSNKPVFQLKRSRKGLEHIKVDGELQTGRKTLLKASYLNEQLKGKTNA